MNVLSLFSGIGGIDLGLQRAGMTIVGQCEVEPFALAVLEKHWPHVWRHTDVRTLTVDLVRKHCPRIDIIAGGFPCQDISAAGKGAGLGGERSGLWFDMLRIIVAVLPDWVLAENVAALRARGADVVCDGLEAAGYTVWPLVVGAEHVGAPHRRHRVWLVAYRGAGERLANALRWSSDGGVPFSLGETEESTFAHWPGDEELAHAARDEQPGQGETERADGERAGAGSDSELVNTEGIGRGEGWAEHGLRERGDAAATSAGASELANTGGTGCEERDIAALATESGFGAGCVDAARLWPSRPGQPQHAWEAPRLVEFPVGGAVDGVSGRLVRSANKHALKAFGNAVVPQVVEEIGRVILTLNGAPQ